ncbi:hypothetical protein ONZ51_g9338 [Trametes cubensis]|uniref:Uncharacterized protein n=1 Tax=Trametes cubensis TaxID=1111947 RepID=A0AAD7TM02_9APHY|nr:hypothetical protein ONZ51_g9338 [Trametes cubensis]
MPAVKENARLRNIPQDVLNVSGPSIGWARLRVASEESDWQFLDVRLRPSLILALYLSQLRHRPSPPPSAPVLVPLNLLSHRTRSLTPPSLPRLVAAGSLLLLGAAHLVLSGYSPSDLASPPEYVASLHKQRDAIKSH